MVLDGVIHGGNGVLLNGIVGAVFIVNGFILDDYEETEETVR